jgi:hypothetical protein
MWTYFWIASCVTTVLSWVLCENFSCPVHMFLYLYDKFIVILTNSGSRQCNAMQCNDLNTVNELVKCMSFIRNNKSSEIFWWLVTQQYFDTTDTWSSCYSLPKFWHKSFIWSNGMDIHDLHELTPSFVFRLLHGDQASSLHTLHLSSMLPHFISEQRLWSQFLYCVCQTLLHTVLNIQQVMCSFLFYPVDQILIQDMSIYIIIELH